MSLNKYATPAERTIVNRLIRAALAHGLTVSVHDGEEWTLKRSRDAKAIREALATTGADNVTLRNSDGAAVGTVLLIWGNGEDVISDLSAPDDITLDAFSAWVDFATAR